MNIALLSEVTFSHEKEATHKTILNFARELVNQKHSVYIICKGDRVSPRFERIGNVPIYRTKKRILSQFIAPALVINSLQKKFGIKFDVIHNFSASPVLSFKTYFVKKFNKDIKTVNTLKSYSRNGFLRFKFLKVLSKADVITVPTQVFKEKLVSRGIPRKKIIVVNSGIDLSKFKSKNKTSLKKKYGLSGKKVVLYYGGLYEEKGLQYLTKAVPLIKKQHPNMIFIIAPRSPLKKAYGEAIPAIINLKDKLLVKNVDDITDYVNMADVVVLPYESMIGTEGNPLCLLESMSCKTAIVMSKFPELEEIVEDGKDVLMVQPRDVKDLAKKIGVLLSNSKLRNTLTETAYKKSKSFDIKDMTNNYLNIYSELVG